MASKVYNEFESIAIPVALQGPDWVDTSWHNDVTASSKMVVDAALETAIVVWVGEDEESERELPMRKFEVYAEWKGNALPWLYLTSSSTPAQNSLFHRGADDEAGLVVAIAEVLAELAKYGPEAIAEANAQWEAHRNA